MSDVDVEPVEKDLSEPEDSFGEDFHAYRAMSKSAVACASLAALGLFMTMFTWSMLVLPLAGVVFGIVALGNIRRYPKELTGLRLAQVGIVSCVLVFVGGIATAITIYATEVPDGYQRISFYNLTLEKNAVILPPALAALNGKRVFIKGYVHPGVSDAGDVRKFVLVEDMGTCCFGGQPELSDMIEVDITSDDSVKYSRRLRRLGGTLRIIPIRRKVVGGIEGGLYKLEADYIK